MCSSHNGEALHVKLLHEIMEIGKLSAEQLQCPAAWPGDVSTRENLKSLGQGPKRLYHMCSGKHLSYLLSLQAQGKPSNEYTNFESVEHKRLEQLLSRMLGRSVSSFRKTTDGCQMPNYALSFRETAGLYRRLAFASGNFASGNAANSSSAGSRNLSSEHGKGTSSCVEDEEALGLVGNLMHQYPDILGGTNRLDSKIMHGSDTAGGGTRFLAKDGADGLLAVAMQPTEHFKNGLGMVIKLVSGYDIRNMEAIVSQIFRTIGVLHPMLHDATPNAGHHKVRTDHIKTEFAFEINEATLTSGGIA
jgi:L-asparaginase II